MKQCIEVRVQGIDRELEQEVRYLSTLCLTRASNSISHHFETDYDQKVYYGSSEFSVEASDEDYFEDDFNICDAIEELEELRGPEPVEKTSLVAPQKDIMNESALDTETGEGGNFKFIAD